MVEKVEAVKTDILVTLEALKQTQYLKLMLKL